MLKILKRYSTYTLVVALLISAISAYYSIVGLTAIFAAAVVPIIIMGAALELGKLVAAVWLKLNWHRASITYKLYLVPAVAFLMALTSMGIFGFLSKAHSDQSLVSGDVVAKIAIYDEKIKTAKDNIDANRKALKQMDEAVDQVMGRSSDEKGADKAVAIRRAQQKERGRLQSEIAAEQKTIAAISEERAPIAAEVRKVEAEVGPLKYIAALIYGDNADANLLESAVRWVIILIVIVFDPLALVLILAAQQSMRWEREDEEAQEKSDEQGVSEFFDRARTNARLLDIEDEEARIREANEKLAEVEPEIPETEIPEPVEPPPKKEDEGSILDAHPYLKKPFEHFKNLKPMVYKPEVKAEPVIEQAVVVEQEPVVVPEPEPEIETANVTVEKVLYDPNTQGYINFEGKQTSIESLKTSHPHLIMPTDGRIPTKFDFGGSFPRESLAGDLYMRTDTRPHRLYKFNGMEWIHVNKTMNTSYLQSKEYVRFLINALNGNQYLPEMLTDNEDDEIRVFLEQLDQ